ncbi:MAG: hypothetical protein WC637_10525 [Victivallales bacterium]
MINKIYLWFSVMGIITFMVHYSYAMPGEAHIEGIELLQGTSPSKGGIGNMSSEKIKAVQDWIDYPSRQSGEYFNRKAGEILTPSNHGALRHNPENVAKALSGTGQVDKAVMNAARMHVIQDVSHNTSPVNGWELTRGKKIEADRILKYVSENRRIPKVLPEWLDRSGPLIRSSDKAIISQAVEKSTSFSRAGKDAVKMLKPGIRISGRAVLPAAIVFESGIAFWDCHETEEAFKKGEIDEPERNRRHAVTVSKANGSLMVLGTGAILTLCMTPAGPAILIIAATSIVAAYALEPVFEKLGLYVAEIYNAYRAGEFAAYSKLSEKFYSSSGVFDITPEQMRNAGIPESDIKGYIQAASNIKEGLPVKTENLEIYDIGRTRTLMAFKEMEFLSNEIK